MFPRGLKTNFIINVAILLFISMLLIDFVMIMTTKKNLLQTEVAKGNLLLSVIESHFSTFFPEEKTGLNSEIEEFLREIINNGSFSCLLVLDKNYNEVYFDGSNCNLNQKHISSARQAVQSGKKTVQFFGKTWGVFWKQKSVLVLSAPLYDRDERLIGGASVSIQLERLYQNLRRTQATLFVYIFLNTLILTSIGFFRLSNMILRPLKRLAKRAEEYKEDEALFFSVRKEDTEFTRLSKALNRMLKRISDDKEKLQSTVSSLEKANLDLKQAQKEIIRAEKMASVGRLSSGIAHEIGNPIGIVLGYLELLRKNGIPETEKRDFILRAENEIHRIRTIIRQLLDFSRPSNGDSKIVSVHGVIKDILEIARFEPLIANIRTELSLSAENDMVTADPNQLRQVFLNLIINAADAISSGKSQPEGKLIIHSENIANKESESEGRSTMLKLFFIDNGPGIPVEHIENIFDPFYTTKEPGKGTGLGLSVCYMIIEGIGGKIQASSQVGKGTTVTIFFPVFSATSNKHT